MPKHREPADSERQGLNDRISHHLMRVAKPAAGLDDMEHEYMLSHALQYIITHCTELHQKFSTFQHPSDYTLQRIARRVTGAWHREASLQDNTTLAEHDDTTSSTALHNPSEQLYQQSHIQNIHTARPLPSKPLKKAPPQYIPKPQITEPPRQGPHKTQDIYVEHRQDLEAIVREPNVNYYHVENFLRTKGYVGGFRPTRILQFTLDQMREDRRRDRLRKDAITDEELLYINPDLVNDIGESIA